MRPAFHPLAFPAIGMSMALSMVLPVALASSAVAQTAPLLFPDTVVVANRVATPAERIAGSVTVIDQQQIERGQFRDIVDALRAVPGVSVVQSGGIGKAASVFIRGANAGHTLVLIDGMRVNDPSGAAGEFNFGHLALDMVERIEVARGPFSALYGADAVGGVINIITKKGQGPASIAMAVEGGTLGTAKAGASVQGESGRFNYNIGLTGIYDRSISLTPDRWRGPTDPNEKDPYRHLSLISRLGAKLADDAELSLFLRYIDSKSQYDDFAHENPNLREIARQFMARLQADLGGPQDRWRNKIGISFQTIARDDKDDPDLFPAPFTPTLSRTSNIGRRARADWQSQVTLSDNLGLTFGGEVENEWFRTRTQDNFGTDIDKRAGQYKAGGFAQLQLELVEALFVTAAARADWHDSFGWHVTGSGGVAYVLREAGTRLKASIGTAYKAPTLYQLYGAFPPFFFGNPNLKPETSVSWEAGFEQKLAQGRIAFGSTYFNTRFRDLIEYDFGSLTDINIGRARAYGLETFLALRPIDGLELRIDHTWIKARDEVLDRKLLRRPEHKLSVALNWRPDQQWDVGVSFLHNGKREDIAPVTFARTANEAFNLVAATLAYRVNEAWQVYGRVENVFDTRYEEPLGYNQPGFAAFLGVRTRFKAQ